MSFSALHPERPDHHGHILVVEDDPIICGLHAAILELEGYQVDLASDGAEALEKLIAEPFDLVLTDCNMPSVDGIELIRELRRRRNYVPVIMVSGSLATNPLPDDVASEVKAALPKPARAEELLGIIDHTLTTSLTGPRRLATLLT